MTDRELLELAAKAAGYIRMQYMDDTPYVSKNWNEDDFEAWNPLTDDGDALRLSVSLRVDVAHDDIGDDGFVYARSFVIGKSAVGLSEIFSGERLRMEATRRAIVRAAAEIGKAMV